MLTVRQGCPLWPGWEGQHFTRNAYWYVEHSPRAAGQYRIHDKTAWALEGSDLDEQVRARLTTMLIDKRAAGEEWPDLTPELADRANAATPLSATDRAVRLLRWLYDRTNGLDVVNIAEVQPELLASSESTEWSHVVALLGHLEKQRLVQGHRTAGQGGYYRVTGRGCALIEG